MGWRRLWGTALLCVALAACAREQPPTVEVTFDDVCARPDGTLVAIQGYFRLPDTMKTYTRLRRTSYQMFFARSLQEANPPFISVTVPGTTRGGAKNQIASIPDGYSYKDLRIFLDDGRAVNGDAFLKITGKLTLLTIGCSVSVSKIQPAQS